MYLVDTNVLSEARRRDGPARDWLRSVNPADLYLSVVTLGEIMKGIALKQRADPTMASGLRVWLELLRRDHTDHILPVDDRVALEWGRIAAIRSRGMADGLIAATAAVHDKIVVTRNIADFADTGVPIIDPWAMPGPSR
ncbi:MAG: type II toxin-antitoxin system VapC family toxin [Acetobacteraceae bacterium]|nr:type II toxin-antitoxin system VapC family toxin [Acetobacteraceae bacterium]